MKYSEIFIKSNVYRKTSPSQQWFFAGIAVGMCIMACLIAICL